jgi:hypothetical protein
MMRDDELPEGTHSIVEHPDDPVATGSSRPSEILEANLEQVGEPRPSQYHEPHHIIPEGDERAARAREILENAGIRPNDAANGVWLPRTTKGVSSEVGITGGAFTSHDSIHTARYFTEITQRLELAEGTNTVPEAMQLIRMQIELGIFPH